MARYSESKDRSVVKVCFEGHAKGDVEFMTVIGFEPNLSKVINFIEKDGWEVGQGMTTDRRRKEETIYVTMIKRNK